MTDEDILAELYGEGYCSSSTNQETDNELYEENKEEKYIEKEGDFDIPLSIQKEREFTEEERLNIQAELLKAYINGTVSKIAFKYTRHRDTI